MRATKRKAPRLEQEHHENTKQIKSIGKAPNWIANIKKRAPKSKQQHHESTRIRTKAPWEHQTYQKHKKNTKIRLKTLGKEAPWSKQKHQENIRIKMLPYWGAGKWECCNVEAKKVMMTPITTEWELRRWWWQP